MTNLSRKRWRYVWLNRNLELLQYLHLLIDIGNI